MERGPVQLNIPRDMFYGDLQTTIPAPRSVEISAGGGESLKRAAELLLSAKNPVIVSGITVNLMIKLQCHVPIMSNVSLHLLLKYLSIF